MPFNLRETLGGLYHFKLGLERRILRLPQTQFVESLRNEGLNLKIVSNSDGSVIVCHICGFALAEMELDGGWSIAACSATEPFRIKCGMFDIAHSSANGCQEETPGTS